MEICSYRSIFEVFITLLVFGMIQGTTQDNVIQSVTLLNVRLYRLNQNEFSLPFCIGLATENVRLLLVLQICLECLKTR